MSKMQGGICAGFYTMRGLPHCTRSRTANQEESSFSNSCIEWVPLITTNYQGDIALAKPILQIESINYWVQGEFRGFSTGAVFHIDKNCLQDARELLPDF